MNTTQSVTIVLLAISCNLDNIGVGLAYGSSLAGPARRHHRWSPAHFDRRG
jgi:putative Mn2+ efflux pump MntP